MSKPLPAPTHIDNDFNQAVRSTEPYVFPQAAPRAPEHRPEPIHLHAQHVGNDMVRVVRGDEIIVAETNSADFVKDAIKELKLRGHTHSTHVVILTDAGSAWNGSIEQHPGA
jgi:hypothetical protein